MGAEGILAGVSLMHSVWIAPHPWHRISFACDRLGSVHLEVLHKPGEMIAVKYSSSHVLGSCYHGCLYAFCPVQACNCGVCVTTG
jgi:hypothetical protein